MAEHEKAKPKQDRQAPADAGLWDDPGNEDPGSLLDGRVPLRPSRDPKGTQQPDDAE